MSVAVRHPKVIADPNVRPGCYLMLANGQAVHGGEIQDFQGFGHSRGMVVTFAVNPVDEAAMAEKVKRRRK